MLTISGLNKSYGERDLLRDISLQVNRGERLGLVGPNGAGKSTLLEIILGEEEPDSGTISRERNLSIGYLPQETAEVGDESVIEISMAITPDMVKLRRAVTDPEGHHDLDPHSAFAELNGFQIEAKAKKILAGLSFRASDFERPARELSGGWIMRAHLARLLVQEPSLLLLDEPTNHLDLQSLLWLQSYLKQYPGAILMVSHDREFLNQLVGSILDLRNGQLMRYRGNYDDYLVQREANEANLLAAYKNQQKEIGRLMLFVERFRAKNTKASQAQSKLKQIARMDKIEVPISETSSIDFRFPQPQRSGQRVLTLKNVDFSYGNTPVYRGLDFQIERGERIVLVGPNGAGKSTLLKLLGGVLPISDGERLLGHNVRAGYYAQNRVEMLKLDRTVLEEALDTPQRVHEQFVRTLLGCFLFSGDDVLKPVRVLSGGEKSRLALVKILLDPPNLLLMDEPTTHLDMASIEALISALEQFEGTFVFISHDVYFIRELARQVVHVENGIVRRYAGDYQYYLDKTSQEIKQIAPSAPVQRQTEISSRDQRRIEAEQRQERSRVKRTQQQVVSDLEKRIAAAEKRQQEITTALHDPITYKSSKGADLNREYHALESELERLHRKWEGEATRLEQLQ
jgi:ATP-binding cassette subfamily F protein 3